MRQRHKKLTRKQRRIKNRVTLRTLFLLAITLIFNTYAWFAYLTTVTSNMTAHVEAWHVQFTVDDQIVERAFPVVISSAYPGMTTVTKTVTITNTGDKDADVDFAIKSIKIFNTTYVATDQLDSGESVPVGATSSTSSALLTKLQNDYPFTVTITPPANTIEPNDEDDLTITFSWPYVGDDEVDTSYGTQAYNYYASSPTEEPIKVVIKIVVTQHNEEE